MSDVTNFVGATISAREATEIRTRCDALGWVMQTRPAGNGQVRVVAITAPAAPEDEPAQGNNDEDSSPIKAAPAPGSGLKRSERESRADYDQPALAMGS